MVVLVDKLTIALIGLIIFIVGVMVFLSYTNIGKSLVSNTTTSITTTIPENESQVIGLKVLLYLNKNLPMNPKPQISLVSSIHEDCLYRVLLRIDNVNYQTYVTENGDLFFPSAINLTG